VQTAERQGFASLLIPSRFVNGLFDKGAPLAETWTMATALTAVTNRIRGSAEHAMLARQCRSLPY